MITGVFNHIAVTGVATALPTRKVKGSDYIERFGKQTVKKLIDSTGVNEHYQAGQNQTASDLAYVAAKRLIQEKRVDPKSIGVLVYVGAHVDYITPATAFVLHGRLGLSHDCLTFDMNISCSAFIYGLYTVSAILEAGNVNKALILIGDTTTKTVSPEDTSGILFGDAGSAILVEKTEHSNDRIAIGLKSDGSRYKSIIIPNGASRNPEISDVREVCEDGIPRLKTELHMNGMDVFNFTMTDVPELFKEFMNDFNIDIENVDALVMHQPNLFIMKHLAKKIKVPMEKVPISLDRYGNTSGNSIPVTLCDAYGDKNGGELNLMLSGFGVGLSWGIATLRLNMDAVLPIVHTDDYFTDGVVAYC